MNRGQSRTISIQGSTPLCPKFGDLEWKEAKYTNVGTGMITSTQTFVIKCNKLNEYKLVEKKGLEIKTQQFKFLNLLY